MGRYTPMCPGGVCRTDPLSHNPHYGVAAYRARSITYVIVVIMPALSIEAESICGIACTCARPADLGFNRTHGLCV